MARYILGEQEAYGDPLIGGKANSLAILTKAGFPVPSWIVLTADAFYVNISGEQLQALEASPDFETIHRLLEDITLAPSLMEEIQQALSALCPQGERVAVRSSALDEDGQTQSFAGVLESYLSVKPEDVIEKIRAIWLSAFSERVLTYRKQHNLPLLPQAPAVLIQRMVEARVSGVAFGIEPITGRKDISMVAAVYGLGTALVSGESDADSYYLDSNFSIVQQHIATKNIAHLYQEETGQIETVRIPSKIADSAALTEKQVQTIAYLVDKCGQLFNGPQDIEWAVEGNNLYLLQSRPITTQTNADDFITCWDNAELVECWSGLTLPLTYSFVRKFYSTTYQHHCHTLGASLEAIYKAEESVFSQLVGLIRGRVYFNENAFHKIWPLIPQFTGFYSALQEWSTPQPKDTPPLSIQEKINLIQPAVQLYKELLQFPQGIQQFFLSAERELHTTPRRLNQLPLLELIHHTDRLEQFIFYEWRWSLKNLMFYEMSTKILKTLCREWCQDESLYTELLYDVRGEKNTGFLSRTYELAHLAQEEPKVLQKFLETDTTTKLSFKDGDSPFALKYEQFLKDFGLRCQEDLKIESPSLQENPTLFLKSLQEMASKSPREHQQNSIRLMESIQAGAEKRAEETLCAHPLKRLLFFWVLYKAREQMSVKEDIHFLFTQFIGSLRNLFLEIGQRLTDQQILHDKTDLFYLERDELFGYLQGHHTFTQLRDLIEPRKYAFQVFAQEPPLPSRCLSHGVVGQEQYFHALEENKNLSSESEAQGLGCSPGTVTGQVRIIRDFKDLAIQAGEILVAEYGDPGLITLFPSAAGILFERGNPLSHTAIVAREMGIPTVVSVSGLTHWLQDGDWVEFDGRTGAIKKISS